FSTHYTAKHTDSLGECSGRVRDMKVSSWKFLYFLAIYPCVLYTLGQEPPLCHFLFRIWSYSARLSCANWPSWAISVPVRPPPSPVAVASRISVVIAPTNWDM